mmetsp:Transcript_14889/g.27993  ORF Transcript_14889/g.27993 Transcript_14889/m.27993 type:complete len:120 (-) Transcript_14889:731-1090(-)
MLLKQLGLLLRPHPPFKIQMKLPIFIPTSIRHAIQLILNHHPFLPMHNHQQHQLPRLLLSPLPSFERMHHPHGMTIDGSCGPMWEYLRNLTPYSERCRTDRCEWMKEHLNLKLETISRT